LDFVGVCISELSLYFEHSDKYHYYMDTMATVTSKQIKPHSASSHFLEQVFILMSLKGLVQEINFKAKLFAQLVFIAVKYR